MTSHAYGARTAGLLPDQCVGSGRVPKARAEPASIAIASRSVLIVEDHPLVGEAMRDVLARSADDLDPHLCPDAATAIAHLLDSQKTWFRIFLDLDVPGANGLSLAKQICELKLQSRCCIVSGLDRPHLIDEVRRLGFLGYIVKAIPLTDFARALGDVLAGRAAFPPATVMSNEPVIRLTRRQEQLLDLVRRGLSSKEIARALFLSEGTVNNGITAAMKALHVTSRSHALAKAFELGLLRVVSSDFAETRRRQQTPGQETAAKSP